MKKFFFITLFILSVFLYYFLNDSYRLSLEAKFYYELGEYQESYKLASKAYKLNKYNRMAFTILTQSKISKIWEKFIKNADEYFIIIDSISNKDIITNKDKIRIKMMLEVIIGEYKNLPNSKLLNNDLKKIAKQKYIKAKELYYGIFKKTA